MKSKLTMKLLGIVVTIATLASLLVGITALPTSAAAGTLDYGQIGTPSLVNHVLVEGVKTSLLAASIDGSVVFAYDGTAGNLYKSTDGGVTFADPLTTATDGIPTDAIAMVVSPKFGSDKTVVLATTDTVLRSDDNGATFYALPLPVLGTGLITSIDVGYYYSGNALSVLVGVAGTTGLTSNVIRINLAQGTDSFIGTMTNDVLSVKFSPNHTNDAEIVCVYTTATDPDGTGPLTAGTIVASRFGNLDWSETSYPAKNVTTDATATNAMIVFPNTYKGATGASFLVGINDGTVPGIYVVSGRHAVAGNVSANKLAGNFYSIAVTDSLAIVYVGETDGTIQKSTAISATDPAFAQVGGNLTGNGNASVVVRGSKIFCSTTGSESALSISSDGGANFAQISLIDVGVSAATLGLQDLKVVDDNTMFLLMSNTSDTSNYLFKTTDGALTWQRIQTIAQPTVYLGISPAFATDKTIAYAYSTTVEMSIDGGITYTASNTGANATAFAVSVGNNMFTGANAGFYQVGFYAVATGITGTVKSIAISPKDSNKIAVGNDAGKVFVSTDMGGSFAEVKTAAGASFGTGVVTVAYAPDGTLYAMDNTTGLKGFIAADWAAVAATSHGTAIVVATDGTLYASDSTAGNGIWRNLSPTAGNEVSDLNHANFAGLNATGSLYALQVVSAATVNKLYAIDNHTAATDYGYTGEVLGFNDTLIGTTTQSAPADKAVLTSTDSATLSWTAVTGAYSYEAQYNTKSDWSGTGNDYETVNATTKDTGALVQGTTYYWRVRVDQSADGSAIYGRWSATRSFVTALTPPEVKTYQYPTNGEMDVPVNPTFTWPTSDVAGATYEFQIAQGGDINSEANPFLIQDWAATSSVNVLVSRQPLLYSTQYRWRVRTITATSKSDWTVSEFVTVAAPVVPSTTATVPPVTTIIVPTQPVATPTVTIINSGTTTQAAQPIPSYLLWAVIAVGAILVIAVIVLIVRTRKI